MSTPRLGCISLDCADSEQLGSFWAALLGGEIVSSRKGITVVRLDSLLMSAMRVEEYVPPTWPDATVPKQAHLDLEVEDLEVEERRAIALGAVRAEPQPDPDSHRVLLDPAGHPFCLSLSANFPK